MNLRLFIPILLFIPVAVLQLTIIPFLSFDYIVPDLVLILVVYFTLQNGQLYGTLLGFVIGLLMDLVSGGIIGSWMFSKTLSGFLAGYFYNENKVAFNTGSFLLVFVVFLCGTVDSIVHSFFSSTESNTSLIFLIFEQGLLPGIYTGILSVVLIFRPSGRKYA